MRADACTEINRYYVISRHEDVGRLSLNKQNGYPELIEVMRKPLALNKITFLNTYSLALDKSAREGKKTDHFFSLQKEGDYFSDALQDLKKAIAEENIDPESPRSGNYEDLKPVYKKIARKMGIRAASRQQDGFDFITYLAKSSG